MDRSYSSNLSTLSSLTEVERNFIKANELFKERKYPESETILKIILGENPNHLKSNYLISDLYFRKARYNKALIHIKKILSINAYDSDAYFIAGNIYKALNSLYDAKEAYGWASRSTKYKSAALSQITEIYHIENVPPKVSIREMVEIAKVYSTEESSSFVNGILDTIYKNYSEKN